MVKDSDDGARLACRRCTSLAGNDFCTRMKLTITASSKRECFRKKYAVWKKNEVGGTNGMGFGRKDHI
jgi:hypothetical protein